MGGVGCIGGRVSRHGDWLRVGGVGCVGGRVSRHGDCWGKSK